LFLVLLSPFCLVNNFILLRLDYLKHGTIESSHPDVKADIDRLVGIFAEYSDGNPFIRRVLEKYHSCTDSAVPAVICEDIDFALANLADETSDEIVSEADVLISGLREQFSGMFRFAIALRESRSFEQAKGVFDDMIAKGVKPDVVTFNTLRNLPLKSLELHSLSSYLELVSHPRTSVPRKACVTAVESATIEMPPPVPAAPEPEPESPDFFSRMATSISAIVSTNSYDIFVKILNRAYGQRCIDSATATIAKKTAKTLLEKGWPLERVKKEVIKAAKFGKKYKAPAD